MQRTAYREYAPRSRAHDMRHDATKHLGKTWPEGEAITYCRACLTDCKTRYRAIVHVKTSNKCLASPRHWAPAPSRGGCMLDSKEKWVRGMRQGMTTDKCITTMIGPKLPTIKEMRYGEPMQFIKVKREWQDAYACPDPDKLLYKNCTKEEADECMTRKKQKEKIHGEIYRGLAHCEIYLHLFSGRRRQHDF